MEICTKSKTIYPKKTMSLDKKLLILFCITFTLFVVLFAYKINLALTDLTPEQEDTFNYLSKRQALNLDYNYLEKEHLKDVKNLMQGVNYLFYLLLLVNTLLITKYKKNKEQLKKMFFWGGLTTVVSLSFLLIVSLIAFYQLFTWFHLIFFPQGNWLFPVDSLLIQTFPQEFFVSLSLKIFLLSLLFGFFSLLIKKFISSS